MIMGEKMFNGMFLDLFGDYAPEETKEYLTGLSVQTCSLNVEKRILDLELFGDKYIPADTLSLIKKKLVSGLKLSKCVIVCRFSPDCFSDVAAKDITEEVRVMLPVMNGFFNGAEYKVEDGKVHITLKYGGLGVIKENGFEEKFVSLASDRFGLNVTLGFSGQTEDVEIALPEPPPIVKTDAPKKASAPSEKKKISFEKRTDKPENGLVYLDNPQYFYGTRITSPVKPLDSIVTPDDPQAAVTVTGWGEVFAYEEKEINTKRGPRVSINFCVSDHTDSIYCKLFMEPEKLGEIAPVKNGNFILFSGKYSYDTWKKEFLLEPRSMALLQPYEEMDAAEEKRVELHCHTNMSAKDAVSSAEDIIKRAYKWGHKAIAITDHGVVQAFPRAASAVEDIKKGGGEFKVIYGVEAYFADDTKGVTDKTKLKRYHQIILVKDLVGLKNLYKLVSKAHLDNFYKKPITMKSEIEKHREGLIIGSACEQGDLYTAIVDGKSHDELIEIAKFYDYLEIQPIGNNEFMIRESKNPETRNKKTGEIIPNRFRHVISAEVIKDFNRKVVAIADELGLPVVATGDVHFLKKDDGILRKILLAGQDFKDFDLQAPLYLKTTEEMLSDFDYFGERAREFVIDNPNKIADMISPDVIPVPKGNYPPSIPGSDDTLREICWDRAHKIYGDELPDIVKERLETELNGIIGNGYSVMYISAQKLVDFSEKNGYLVGSRGSVGSSFAATMAGISEVNPLPPHYYCPSCRYSEFYTHGEYGSGFDMPDKECPKCGTKLKSDGHDIPFQTFLGFKGDKVPDIDLNFSDEFQTEVQKYTESLFGRENVFKAGTVSTVAEKTAFGFAKAYCEAKGIILSRAELSRLASAVEKAEIKTTTGQHPAGMIVVPKENTIYDFCPIQHPADDPNSDILTTHFEFKAIHDTILKLDELGHVVPTTYKYLEEYSGVKIGDVPLNDPAVYSLFLSPEALGVTSDEIDSLTGTFGLPEFGTKLARDMLTECKPKTFADLLQISGLSHGKGVWVGNAKDLIDNGTCTVSNVIGTRDNIMMYLIHQGMEEGRAFKITETVRKGLVKKGKVSKDEWHQMEDDMRKVNVPEWYIESCGKIEYMFPKAHAAAYVISALRIAWYKINYPVAYYCAYFTARPEDVDVDTLVRGKDAVRQSIKEIRMKGKEASDKELKALDKLLIFNEMMSRGIDVLPIDLMKSHAVKYLPEDGKMRLPFVAISGVGRNAAFSVYNAAQSGNFLSKEDFQVESGVSKTVIKTLSDMGAFKDLPDTNQMTLF